MDEVRLIDASKIENQKIHYESEQKENVELFLGGAMAVMGMIHNAPTIAPESLRPVAHWDMEEDAVGDPIVWTCSNCKDSIIMYDGTPMENGYKYCPYCGARMEDVPNA